MTGLPASGEHAARPTSPRLGSACLLLGMTPGDPRSIVHPIQATGSTLGARLGFAPGFDFHQALGCRSSTVQSGSTLVILASLVRGTPAWHIGACFAVV